MAYCGSSMSNLAPEVRRTPSCSMRESHTKETSCGDRMMSHGKHSYGHGGQGGYGGYGGNWGWALIWFLIIFFVAWFVLWAVRPEAVQKKDSRGHCVGDIDGGKVLVGALLIALVVCIIVWLVWWAVGCGNGGYGF